MCTLTFIPDRNGYMLAMNRDERISRGISDPPAVTQHGGIEAVYPRDIEGGTWIAVSGRGTVFALLNWNDIPVLHNKTRSRGSLIPTLISCVSSHGAHAMFKHLELQGILPFRLVGIFPDEEEVSEWRWDQASLECERFAWRPRQWCSSSLSDRNASRCRRAAYARDQEEADAGSIEWLRRLHASHDPGHGPFSTCVHRQDVQTVSYTEIICTPEEVRCNYLAGSPCQSEGTEHSVSIGRIGRTVACYCSASA